MMPKCPKPKDEKRIQKARKAFLDSRNKRGNPERKTRIAADGTPQVLNCKGVYVPDQKALAANKKSPCLIQSKINRKEFGIHHYAGKVMYDSEGFVFSNQDTLPTDLSDCALKSTNEILSKHLNNEKCSASSFATPSQSP